MRTGRGKPSRLRRVDLRNALRPAATASRGRRERPQAHNKPPRRLSGALGQVGRGLRAPRSLPTPAMGSREALCGRMMAGRPFVHPHLAHQVEQRRGLEAREPEAAVLHGHGGAPSLLKQHVLLRAVRGRCSWMWRPRRDPFGVRGRNCLRELPERHPVERLGSRLRSGTRLASEATGDPHSSIPILPL
jgi:hypothetical protein